MAISRLHAEDERFPRLRASQERQGDPLEDPCHRLLAGHPYLVLDLDDALSPEAVELIRRVSGVIRVRVI